MTNANYCTDCNTTLVLHADGTITCSCDSLDAGQKSIPESWKLTLAERAEALREEGLA